MSEGGQFRQLRGATGIIVKIITVSFMLYSLLQVSGVFARFGIYIDTIPYLAGHLAFGLAIVFLLVPPTKSSRKDRLPWYDALLAILVAAQPVYVFFAFGQIQYHLAMGEIKPYELGLTMLLFALVLEAGRRTTGLSMPIITVLFIVYSLTSNYLPGILRAPKFDFVDLARNLGMWSGGLYGRVTDVSATILVMFILMAYFLLASGAARFFIDLAISIAGRWRGGPAKVAVLASALMGTVSGSASANAATVGLITIPMMKNIGYQPYYAGAIEAVASNGGQIMPPVMGIAAFIMADFLRISYASVVIAATIPAILYFTAVLVMVHLQAVKSNIKALPPEQIPSFRKTLIRGYPYLIPIFVLLYIMLGLDFTPQLAAIYSMLALVLITLFRRQTRMGPRAVIRSLDGGAKGMNSIIAVIAMAGMIIGCVELTGLGVRFSSIMTVLASGNLLLLLTLAAIASLVLGMGMPTSACYILLAITIAPTLVALGVKPIAAHMFIFYWGLAAQITPPVCVATFVAAAIADAPVFKTGWQAMRLGISAYIVPFAFVYGPGLLMVGTASEIVTTAITALVGIVALSAAVEGYLLVLANPLQRLLLLVGAVALIFPGLATNIIGFSLIVGVLLWQMPSWRASRRAQAEATGGSS